MNDAIGKRKRGVWIGVYVLVEVFAFAAYLFAGALVMTGRKDGMMLDEVWDFIQILLFLVIAAVEFGYALIWRMAVMYPAWSVCWPTRRTTWRGTDMR